MSYQVKVGICDIDSYDMIFYSNYLKYNERAAYHLLGEVELKTVKNIKYLKSVQWDSTPHVESHILSVEGNAVLLLHVWVCDGKPMNQSVIEYSCSSIQPREKIGEIPRVSKFLLHDWQKNLSFMPETFDTIELPFYTDMSGMGGKMLKNTCLDLMERQRTELIGGQRVLQRLKTEERILIVVMNIYDLKFGDAVLDVGDTITCQSGGVFATDNTSFMVRQLIKRGSDVICDGVVKLCFVKDGTPVPFIL